MQQSFAGLIGSARQQPWSLWWIQFRRFTRIEIRRNLFTRRAWWIYFLAFVPAFIILLHLVMDSRRGMDMGDDTQVLAAIVQVYYVRLGIFFGCLGIFSRLIRGEMIERSLHYYLLSPVRRELLVFGKFVAGVLTSVTVFGLAVFAAVAFMYLHFGHQGMQFLTEGPGAYHMKAY